VFDKLFEKIRRVDEKVFYHVTNVDNLDSIKEEGLRADSYITDSLEDAEAMQDIMADEHETQATVLKFDLTPEQIDKLTVDESQPNAYLTHEILNYVEKEE